MVSFVMMKTVITRDMQTGVYKKIPELDDWFRKYCAAHGNQRLVILKRGSRWPEDDENRLGSSSARRLNRDQVVKIYYDEKT